MRVRVGKVDLLIIGEDLSAVFFCFDIFYIYPAAFWPDWAMAAAGFLNLSAVG